MSKLSYCVFIISYVIIANIAEFLGIMIIMINFGLQLLSIKLFVNIILKFLRHFTH